MQPPISKPLWKQLLVPTTLIIIFILLVWGVIKIQQSFQVQPNLDVAIPEISNTKEDSINLTGKTVNDASVTINGKKVMVDKDGNFTYLYVLNPGENKVVFKAQKGSSEPTTVEKIVIKEQKIVTIPSPASSSNALGISDSSALTSSGPTENVGIIGLVGLTFSLGFYIKSRKRAKKEPLTYKLFT